tara:strand:- start:127 stop:1260 length:1134 start_codon:yes stop_codon:yes gene_type:complete
MIGFPSRNPLEEMNLQRNYPLQQQQQQVIQKQANPLVTGAGQTQMQMQPQPRTGMAGLFDKLTTRSGTTGLSGLENFAQALDPLILPELRGGEAIRERGAQRVKAGDVNKTIEYLEANGMADMAAIIKANPSAAGNVLSAIAANRLNPKDNSTNLMKNYQFMRARGLSHEEALAQIKSGTTINTGNMESTLGKKLKEKMGTTLADQYAAGGSSSQQLIDLNILQELAPMQPSGIISGRIAKMFPELQDVSAVREAIIKRLAPSLRVEGSGSTSDVEFAAMLNSLGSLTQTPEANMAIVAVMQSKAQFNIDRARIIGEFALGDMTSENMQEINRRIAELEDNMQIPAQVQAILSTYKNQEDRNPITVWNPETGKFEKQ